jgi:hypothetical protein
MDKDKGKRSTGIGLPVAVAEHANTSFNLKETLLRLGQ